MSTLKRQTAFVLSLAVVAVGLSCCGSGTAQSSTVTAGLRKSHREREQSPSMAGQPTRPVPATGGCGAVIVGLGQSPGAIDFQLKCRPYPRKHKVAFALGLTPLPNRHAGRIQEFRHHPVAREPGVGLRSASCSLLGGGLSCTAHADSLVRISGRIWVKKGTECDSFIGVSESRPVTPCSGVCASDAPAAVVAEMRPRGC